MLSLKLNDKKYKAFIDYAIKTCEVASLVFEKDEIENQQYIFREKYTMLSESVVKIENTDVHPNTGSFLENADILYFEINKAVTSFLKQANGIFDWDGKKLPEELCFYRADKIWFACICHERLLHIYNETCEDLDFFKKNKMEFFYEN